MSVVKLYNGIYRALANDSEILNLLGIGTSADNLTKAKRIQKRSRPQNTSDNVPLIAFYTPGGGINGGNDYVFDSVFVFDVYTNDNVDLAQRLADKLLDLFHRKIQPFAEVENFETNLVNQHESAADSPNIYCFTTVLRFSVSLSK